MKITGYSDSLRITAGTGRDIGSLLRGISVGDRVEARIISREGNIALLDLAGKRLRADFTAGIPAGNTVELILSEKNSTGAVFRLPVKEGAADFPVLLKQYFMTGNGLPDRGTISGLWRLVSAGQADITSINLFLAGIKKDHLKENKITDLINRLNSFKVPEQTITDISLAVAGKLPAPLFSAVLFFMEKAGRKQGFNAGNERIDEILGDLDALDDELFTDLLKLLAAPGVDKEGYGKFPVPGDGDFSGFEYVYKNDSFFMTFSLSELGRISLLILSDGPDTDLIIGADSDRSVELLEGDSEELGNLLRQNGSKIRSVRFFNMKKVVDKLQKFCSDFHLKSGIDVKI